MTTALEPIRQEHEVQATALEVRANALTISTVEQCQEAVDLREQCKQKLKAADILFDPSVKAAHEAHKKAVALKKLVTDPLDRAERTATQKIQAFMEEQEKARREEQRRLQAEADEKARREREALEKKAAAAKKPETKERYTEQAAAVITPVVTIPSATKIVAGISTRKTWSAEITDREAFLTWACTNQRFDMIMPNDKQLQATAAAQKRASDIPGVKFVESTTVASKGR